MVGNADHDYDIDEDDWDDDPLPPSEQADDRPRLAGSLMLFVGALAFFGTIMWARMGSPPGEIVLLVGAWCFFATVVKIAEITPWL